MTALSLRDRFEPKVDQTTTPDGCWTWTGATNSHGYGTIRRGPSRQETIGAHVAAWEIERGPVPPGMCVLHRCDNRPCVRVDHLFLGTKGENNADRDAKGRTARGDRSGRRLHPESWIGVRMGPAPEDVLRGERSGAAKLTDDDVREIRRLRAVNVSGSVIARQFGISKQNVSSIGLRQTWKHVAD